MYENFEMKISKLNCCMVSNLKCINWNNFKLKISKDK